MAPRVFLITGTSTGFGSELVKTVLFNGDVVVATARNSSKLDFSSHGANSHTFLSVDLDVTSKGSINAAFDAALEKFGRVDVVVNNAGYGLAGEFESLSERQIRTQMEVNFFGLIDVTRKACEVMRNQKPQGGVIQQITSIGGQVGVPTFTIYCASKWAVEGFTEALQQELKPEWNIHLTCIEPGGFRTDWAGRSMDFAENKNPAYDHIDARAAMGKRHMQQAGDPPKAAEAFYKLATMKDPPIRCILGSDAYSKINQKLQDYKVNIERFQELSNSTDVDGYKAP
ncbi:NAD(P)-binding protein [Rhizodiscina lignyota]|uniref:NAD(P)-binding protein n=1 Tax=Rhizodiscina lignyota TaxID=1504668 RepID=A0A9P4IHK8_9PEZI|nr:NAD(P)-binding protein [Rhizodiscina lignyota]